MGKYWQAQSRLRRAAKAWVPTQDPQLAEEQDLAGRGGGRRGRGRGRSRGRSTGRGAGRGRSNKASDDQACENSPAASTSGPFHDENSDLASSPSEVEVSNSDAKPASSKAKAKAKAKPKAKNRRKAAADKASQLADKLGPPTKTRQPQSRTTAKTRQEEDESLFANMMQVQADAEAELAIKLLSKELFGESLEPSPPGTAEEAMCQVINHVFST